MNPPLDPAEHATSSHGTQGPADIATQHFLQFRRTGDMQELQRALLACAPSLHRFANRWCDAHEADDLVHDSFVVAIRRCHAFDPEQRLGPWIFGILRNLARSRHRRRWRRFATATWADGGVDLPDARDPAAIVERSEWLEVVRHHIAHLPERYRVVVQGHLVHGQPLVELAASLGLPASTVRTQFERGMRELRRGLPAPILVGLSAWLATRSAAGAAPPAVGRRVVARFGAALAAVAMVLVVLAWITQTWLRPQGPVAAVATGAIAATAPAARADAPTNSKPLALRDQSSAPTVGTVHVHLHLPDGTPAGNVAVLLHTRFRRLPPVRALPDRRTAFTDANGDVRFDDVPVGRVAVAVSDIDVAEAFDLTAEGQRRVVAFEPATWVRIKLVDAADGRPIAGGVIMASGSNGMTSPGHVAAITDDGGGADIASTVTPVTIWAMADGYLTSPVYQLRSRDANDAAVRRHVRLRAGAQRRTGRVEAAGQPVAHALVAVWSGATPLVPPTYGFTDQDGRFEVGGLAAGAWRAAAIAADHAPSCSTFDDAEPSAVVRLTTGGTIEGRVVRPPGMDSPIQILAQDCEADSRNAFSFSGCLIERDGTFRIGPLAPSTYRVAAIVGESRPFGERHVAVVQGERSTCDLGDGASPVAVRVTDERGHAVSGCLLRAMSPLRLVGVSHSARAITDAQGLAFLPARAASQPLFVYLAHGVNTDSLPAVSLAPDATAAERRVVVPDAAMRPGIIRGTLPSGIARRLYLDSRFALELATAGGSRRVEVDPGGRFEAVDVPAGNYRLQIVRGNGLAQAELALATATLAPGESLDLELPAEPAFGEADLQLRSVDANAPVLVQLQGADGTQIEPLMLAAGHSELRVLPAGRYRACYAHSDGEPRHQPFEVSPGGRTVVLLERTAGRPVRLEVRERDESIDCTRLLATVRRQGAAAGAEHVLLQTAGRVWTCALDLQPGTYAVSVRSGSGAAAAATLRVPDAQAEVVMALRMP